ncbi:MAG: hypothetical protein D6759_16990 [Chloroflexi bacterium]|nr:MAG: hypothetical protein D6759_16990 [Chloroflexota bacterium]
MDERQTVEMRIRLPADQADRLNRLTKLYQVDEGRIIEEALNILFTLTDLFGERAERESWSLLSEAALYRIWDNEEDAIYDKRY